MTLGPEPTWREMARADKERAEAAAFADWQHERWMESVDAEEQRWLHRWAHQSQDRARESHPSRWVDRRQFAVDGDVDRPDL